MSRAVCLLALVALSGCPDPLSPSSDTSAAACHAKGEFITAMHHNVCDAAYLAEMENLVATDPDCKITFGGRHLRGHCPTDAGPDADAGQNDATDAMEAQ